jgi:hypothetical protein
LLSENKRQFEKGFDDFYNLFDVKLSNRIVMSWDKATAIRFFQTHVGQTILIKEETSRIILQGRLTELEELGLCSSVLVETSLQLKSMGLSVALTLHDDFLGAHLMIMSPDSKDPEVSIPYQIRYENLIVEDQ